MAVLVVVALLVAIGGTYAVAGYASASSRISAANHAIDIAVAHRGAFDEAPSVFAGSSDPQTLKSDAATFVQTWNTESATIAADETAITSADSGLRQQQWLTLIRRGNVSSASARVSHARKALTAAGTVAAERVKEGAFLSAYADALNDLDVVGTDFQAGDFIGGVTAVTQFQSDTGRAVDLATDTQFPPELHAFMVAMQVLANDFLAYLTALSKGDSATGKLLSTKTGQDLDAMQVYSTASIGTKIDEFYQPYLDTYHRELTWAGGGQGG